ncbi:oxidoreductase [Lasiosphaeris hirsuta]|uniref:Oxidoreductase n=1 Tax=Lasiosphaeris hirsuta TaxID=260670 RepID=A0AA40EA77_9PEZI|nr:oxidoreductase [Lasiosphaeris hirsuta]
MSRPWILLCPSTRGIGFHLTRHLLRTTRIPILATARSPDHPSVRSALLAGLINEDDDPSGRLEVVTADVTAEPTIAAAARRAHTLFPPQTHHLHLAFALPGILHPEKSPAAIDYAKALETFKVNTLGPMLLMKHFEAFLPRKGTVMDLEGTGGSVPRHALWVNMSARVGSVSDNRLGGWFSYRGSKAAVNSLAKSLDRQLVTRSGNNAMAVAYHPGTVKTELSREFWGSAANDMLLDPEVAVEKMANVITALGLEQRGRCWDYKGQEVPP